MTSFRWSSLASMLTCDRMYMMKAGHVTTGMLGAIRRHMGSI